MMGKRELVGVLNLSSWCLVMVERLFLVVPWGCLRFVMWYFLIILTYYFLLAPNGRIALCIANSVIIVKNCINKIKKKIENAISLKVIVP